MQFQRVLFKGSIVIAILAGVWMLLCALICESLPNSLLLKEGYIFDYVIVGAGTAGSVVTSILSKYTNGTVLLIEAGGQFGFFSKIPILATFQQQGINDWSFLSVPQKYSSKGLEKNQQSLPRGKGLGGSAQLNYMLHFDELKSDFESWTKEYNLSNWNWNKVLPYLKMASGNSDDIFEIPNDYSKLTEALFEAETEFSNKPWIFRRSQYNIKNGLRYSVFQRFLLPEIKNSNLYILTQTLAKKIILSSNPKKVESILVSVKDETTRKEQLFKISIRRELLVCAGAFQTPQLLLASGIGNKYELTKANIQVQHHLRRVGKNLHDHLNLPVFVSIDEVGPTLNQRTLLNPINILKYFLFGSGFYGNFGVVGHVSTYKKEPFMLTLFGVGGIEEAALMGISNFKRPVFRALFPRYYNTSQEGFVLIASCLKPKSRGMVFVVGESMRKNPLIDPNFLSQQYDINCTISAVRKAVTLTTSVAFAKLRPKIHWPKLTECANFGPFENDFTQNKPSDKYLECLIRHVGLTSHHPGGSCVMGTDSRNSVVDSQLRLHGVRNLRVVDASVIPTPVSGNPNTMITVIALRVASWVLADEFNENIT